MIVHCIVHYLEHRDEHHVPIVVEKGSPGDSSLHSTVLHYLEHRDDHHVSIVVEDRFTR